MTDEARPAYTARDARVVLRGGEALIELIEHVSHGEAGLQKEVRRAFEDLREEMVRRDLAAIPVARIKETTKGGLRIGLLEKAGYSTVLAVLDATQWRLETIPGVGPATAQQAIAAAHQIADAVRAHLQFRVDLDPGNPRSTALVSALYRWDAFTKRGERVRGPAAAISTELDATLREAAPAASALRMMFRGTRRKTGARTALARVGELLDRAENGGLASELQEARGLIDSQTDVAAAAWKDFERRAIEYYGRLGEIVDLGLDIEAAEGFLPADIIAAVNEQRLVDTFRRVSLRGYQAFGARFAIVQRRAIIGDEMGLGKTIQAIAVMAHLRAVGRDHFLVACPASVIVNWAREIRNHSTLTPYLIHGFDRTSNHRQWLRNGGVAVTTIDSLYRFDAPDDVRIGMLVVDEAHYAKNPEARRSVSVRRWTRRIDRVLFLTGTPMENRVEEFRTLVSYLRPDLIHAVRSSHAAAGPTAFRKTVAPVYLRRNQEDVLQELPDLIRVDEWVELGSGEQATYRRAVAEANFTAMRRAAFASGHRDGSAKLFRLL